MFKLTRLVLSIFRFSPLGWYRKNIKVPLVAFVYETIELYKQRTRAGVNNVRDVLFRGSVIAFVTSLLVWLSIFMYVAFYYAYVPAISHERPVYLQFKSCGGKEGVCSFPSAHVLLTKRQQLLMFGQPYKIQLELDMPESPKNRELGMFMVCADFRGKNGKLITHSCRSAMLHYRSALLQFIHTVIYSPFYILGSAEEKQTVSIELFTEYNENEDQPVTDVYIEIQSQFIELYSAKFLIHAQFSGFRYVMFHWPIVSAAIGITTNLFFIAMLCVASWYQLINSEEYINYKMSKYHSPDARDKLKRRKLTKGDTDDSSGSMEDSYFEDLDPAKSDLGNLNSDKTNEEFEENEM